MTTQNLVKEFVRFADDNLVPKLSKLGAAAFYFGIGVMLDQKAIEEKLRMLGVADKDGKLDIDRIKSGAMFAIDKNDGQLELFGFTLDRDDAVAFFKQLEAA